MAAVRLVFIATLCGIGFGVLFLALGYSVPVAFMLYLITGWTVTISGIAFPILFAERG